MFSYLVYSCISIIIYHIEAVFCIINGNFVFLVTFF